MIAIVAIFAGGTIALAAYVLRLIRSELWADALDYPRFLRAVEKDIEDPLKIAELSHADARLARDLGEALQVERGSLLVRERGLERRARFESILSRLKLIGTGAMLLGLFVALAGITGISSSAPQPLERLADPSFSSGKMEVALFALLTGFGVSLLSRVSARMLQRRFSAELSAYAQLVSVFELKELALGTEHGDEESPDAARFDEEADPPHDEIP